MKPVDFEPFAEMMNALADVYGKRLTEFALGIYWGALKGYELAAVREAFDRHVRNPDSGQFMPKPADVARMLQGSTQDAALVAWSKVDRAVREVGTYRSVVFDDPVIHSVITDMGGGCHWDRKARTSGPLCVMNS